VFYKIVFIQMLEDNVVTSVWTSDGDINNFPINIELHQGSTLSPYLLDFMMDEVTRDIQSGISWCMLFADDVILVDERKTGGWTQVGFVEMDFGGKKVLDLIGLK
jgi:hypothetical protein